jgi:hypothetical protein
MDVIRVIVPVIIINLTGKFCERKENHHKSVGIYHCQGINL